MAGVQKAKSEETNRRVLEAAAALMAEGGLPKIQIRTVAERAGYAVGSVYKHYKDIDALILAVNSITLARIRETMRAATAAPETPVERLKALAHAYLDFACRNENLWRGLFDHHLPPGESIPEQHKAENVALLTFIGREIKALEPDMDEEAVAARARTCFAAVHGLVTVSLEARFVGLAGDVLNREMDFLVERLAGEPPAA